MDRFERLNQQTRDYKNNDVDRFSYGTPATRMSSQTLDRLNNQTYYARNGQFSRHYK